MSDDQNDKLSKIGSMTFGEYLGYIKIISAETDQKEAEASEDSDKSSLESV